MQGTHKLQGVQNGGKHFIFYFCICVLALLTLNSLLYIYVILQHFSVFYSLIHKKITLVVCRILVVLVGILWRGKVDDLVLRVEKNKN